MKPLRNIIIGFLLGITLTSQAQEVKVDTQNKEYGVQ